MAEIQICIDRQGVKKVLLLSGKKKPTSIETLALYAQLEPLIDQFRSDVRKTISAHVDFRCKRY